MQTAVVEGRRRARLIGVHLPRLEQQTLRDIPPPPRGVGLHPILSLCEVGAAMYAITGRLGGGTITLRAVDRTTWAFTEISTHIIPVPGGDAVSYPIETSVLFAVPGPDGAIYCGALMAYSPIGGTSVYYIYRSLRVEAATGTWSDALIAGIPSAGARYRDRWYLWRDGKLLSAAAVQGSYSAAGALPAALADVSALTGWRAA